MIGVEEFAQESKAWLAEHSARAPRDYGAICPPDLVDQGLSWQRFLYESGRAGIHWPVEFGGQGLTAAHQAQWLYECAVVGVPGVTSCVPMRGRSPVSTREVPAGGVRVVVVSRSPVIASSNALRVSSPVA